MTLSKRHPLTGHPVYFHGTLHVITGINYLGDLDVIKHRWSTAYFPPCFVWSRCSFSPDDLDLPPEHPRHCRLVGEHYQKRLAKAIHGWNRLDYWLEEAIPCSRKWRRARAHETTLRRFFQRCAAKRPERYKSRK